MEHDKFFDFLDEKGANGECLSCKQNKWTAPTQTGEPLFELICINCGFTKMYNTHFYKEWLKGKEKTNESAS
jgi:hypothetical protein